MIKWTVEGYTESNEFLDFQTFAHLAKAVWLVYIRGLTNPIKTPHNCGN